MAEDPRLGANSVLHHGIYFMVAKHYRFNDIAQELRDELKNSNHEFEFLKKILMIRAG